MKTDFKAYLAVETLGGPVWSEDNARLGFVYNAPGFFQVYQTGTEAESWPRRVSFSDDRCTNPRFLPDGGMLFLRDAGGDENFQIIRMHPGGETESITEDLKAKYGILAITEEALYYSSNSENKSLFELHRRPFPLTDSPSKKIFTPEKGMLGSIRPNTETGQVAITVYHNNFSTEVFLLDERSGQSVSLTGDLGENTRWEASRWLNDGSLLVRTDYGGDKIHLARLDTQDGGVLSYDAVKALDLDTDFVAYGQEDDYTWFSVNDNGFSSLYRARFTSKAAENLEKIALPVPGIIPLADARVSTIAFSLNRDGSKLAAAVSSAEEPSNLWILDTASLKWKKISGVSTPALNTSSFAPLTSHWFDSFDGEPVPYYRYLPKGNPPENGWPAVFIIHGGPEAQIRPGFNNIAQFLTAQGLAVLAPNIRGSDGYGKRYLNLDNVEKRLDSIADIAALANHLNSNDSEIDASRLGIMGASYGGFAVLSSLTEHPELWKAGVDIFGIANFETFLENTADWRRGLREAEYGSLKTDREVLKRISPVHRIDRIQAPLLIIQGDNDERVPLSESIQMYEAVKALGLKTELIRFADEGHGITTIANKVTAYGRIAQWFSETL